MSIYYKPQNKFIMRKITTLVFLSLCAIGFSQNKGQNKEIKMSQKVEMPAAFYNNPARAIGEQAGVSATGVRNTNISVPFTGTYGSTNNRTADVIYDNGPYWNVAGSPNVSLLETGLGMNTLGFAAQSLGGYSIADDFILTEGAEISTIDVFAYQTNEVAPTITGVFMQIWDGDPSAGGNVIWGNLTTNILEDSFYADANRASDPTNTARQINLVTAYTNNLTLAAGTYWLQYTFEGTGASGPWAPPIAILGETTTGNALQYSETDGAWSILEDSGSFTPQGMPFIIYGTPTVGIKENALSGFNFYPNPTTDVLNLKANSNIESVSLFNLLGQKVMSVKVDATTSNISLGGLATGNYLMNVTVNGQTGTYKITKN